MEQTDPGSGNREAPTERPPNRPFDWSFSLLGAIYRYVFAETEPGLPLQRARQSWQLKQLVFRLPSRFLRGEDERRTQNEAASEGK